MARRVVVEVTCDVCGGVSDAQSENFRIIFLSEEYELDMCSGCTQVFGPKYIAVSRPVPKSERMIRPDKDKPARKSTPKADGPYLPKAAVEAVEGRPRTHKCPVKGCGYMGTDNRSIGVHKSKVHGIRAGAK